MIESDSWPGKVYPFDICLNQEKGWLVGLVQEGFAWGWGSCLKYFERGWNIKEQRGHKDLKKGGKLGQGLGALKRGAGTPLWTMILYGQSL